MRKIFFLIINLEKKRIKSLYNRKLKKNKSIKNLFSIKKKKEFISNTKMVDSVTLHEDLKNILKEGFLEKESRTLK